MKRDIKSPAIWMSLFYQSDIDKNVPVEVTIAIIKVAISEVKFKFHSVSIGKMRERLKPQKCKYKK